MTVDLAILHTLALRLSDREIDARGYLTEIAQLLTRWVGCSRAGLWIFVETDRGPALHCVAMVGASTAQRIAAPIALPTDMIGVDHPEYFTSLLNEGCVVADDARSHPSTLSFLRDYLVPEDVYSLLDVCHSVNGELFGVVTCEQVGRPITWSARQLQTVRQFVSRAGLTLREASVALGVAYRRPSEGKAWNDTGWE
ncbi:GAF domain-containing protein [Aquincola sp. MAHUQ-54]|uniref:GAF domain-containing protein n=1 Tax=Aquincola agrisoli TaxID=3119538 RepID=A0AAW9Q8H7_9BURK